MQLIQASYTNKRNTRAGVAEAYIVSVGDASTLHIVRLRFCLRIKLLLPPHPQINHAEKLVLQIQSSVLFCSKLNTLSLVLFNKTRLKSEMFSFEESL